MKLRWSERKDKQPAEPGAVTAPAAAQPLDRARSIDLRIEELRRSPAFANYQHVREQVLLMLREEGPPSTDVDRPSGYWREELANFEYMFDASPLIIEKLRHHTYHVTGLRVYDYRTHRDEYRRQFARKLKALMKLGDEDLLVPESPLLGGFGFEIDGRLINIDTMKFFEVLIALDRGAILGEFRNAQERRVVWEIGSGWGGFGYQFKSLLPDVTYVLTDFPELFLFSGTYLMTAFPDARTLFVTHDNVDSLAEQGLDADFVFVPYTMLERLRLPRVDLTVNMVSFQEMTSAQVEAYVRRAFELGSPYLYSLNRDRSPYNPELSSVREIMSRWYWPHEVEILPVAYTKMLDERTKKQKLREQGAKLKEGHSRGYKHVCGWKRVLT